VTTGKKTAGQFLRNRCVTVEFCIREAAVEREFTAGLVGPADAKVEY
jgi:hypothetical protein